MKTTSIKNLKKPLMALCACMILSTDMSVDCSNDGKNVDLEKQRASYNSGLNIKQTSSQTATFGEFATFVWYALQFSAMVCVFYITSRVG